MSSRRNKGGGGGHGEGGEERWLLPYADMITLLLGLFIVLFAMSSVDAKKFDNVKRSLAETFRGSVLEESGGVLPGSNGVLDPTAPSQAETDSAVSIDDATRRSAERFHAQTKQLEQMAKQLNLGNDVDVARNEIGIQISIAGDALFPSGSYQLASPGIRDELTRIARELGRFGAPIRIEGHTDGAPMNGEFGNQGLSSNRALAVWKFFRDRGFPVTRMETVAKGASSPKVQPPYPTASVPANRRIEIIVLEPGAQDGFDNDAADAASSSRTAAPRSATPKAQVDRAIDEEFAIVAELAATGKGIG